MAEGRFGNDSLPAGVPTLEDFQRFGGDWAAEEDTIQPLDLETIMNPKRGRAGLKHWYLNRPKLMRIFDENATAIQAAWRGYYIRKIKRELGPEALISEAQRAALASRKLQIEKLKFEAEQRRIMEEEERLRREQAERVRMAEEFKKREAEKAAAAAAGISAAAVAAAAAEADRLRREEEEKRLEQERLRREEEERLIREEEEKLRLEEERVRLEEEERIRLEEEERVRLEEERLRLEEEERQRLEAEKLRLEEEERLRLEEEERLRLEEEERLRAEEEEARKEAERIAAGIAAKLAAEEAEKARLAEEEEAARQEAERIAAGIAAKLAAEEAEKARLEEEEKAKREEEIRNAVKNAKIMAAAALAGAGAADAAGASDSVSNYEDIGDDEPEEEDLEPSYAYTPGGTRIASKRAPGQPMEELRLLSARILGHEVATSPKNGKKYVVYKLEVVTDATGLHHKLITFKRYSTFRKLCDMLIKEKGYSKQDLPRLPGRSLVGNLSRQLIEDRKIRLNDFLTAAIRADHLQWGIRINDSIAVYKRRVKSRQPPQPDMNSRPAPSGYFRN